MPANIQDLLNRIANARYGEQVRSAIHDSIEQCYTDVTEGKTSAEAAALLAQQKAALAESKAMAAQEQSEALEEYMPIVEEYTPDLQTIVDTWNSTTNAQITKSIKDANDGAKAAQTQATSAKAIVDSWTGDNGLSVQINNVINNAITKISEVNTAASGARNAAQEASNAATEAGTQAQRAETAADYINGLTISSEDVGPDATATASMRTVDGHADIHFVLKQGQPGINFTIKGSAYATLEDLQAATSSLNPQEGDQYNVGPGAPTPYDIYRWTGSAWEWQGQIGLSFEDLSNNEIDTLWNGTAISSTTSKYINHTGLLYLIVNKIKAALTTLTNNVSSLTSNKVDKKTGYDLVSTSDYSTLKSSVSSKVDKRSGYDLVETATITNLQNDVSALKVTTFTITLPVSWSNKTLTVLDVKFLASGYVYQVSPSSESFAEYAQCQIYADDITTNGSITFHCDSVPLNSLTVKVVRMVSA